MRQRRRLLVGAACAMKATAWLAVPVIATMVWSRDGARPAGRFAATSVAAAVTIIAATAPAALINGVSAQSPGSRNRSCSVSLEGERDGRATAIGDDRRAEPTP